MATKMLDVSISFIGRFIQWVDVVGAYAQWLVRHSGRREAGEALKEAAKAIAIAAELKVSIGSQKGLLAELKTRVEAVKKVADKALVKSG